MNNKSLVLEKTIIIPTKPKNKSIMFDIIDSYPAELRFEYVVCGSYGTVADINVVNIANNKRLLALKPHNVSNVLSKTEWYVPLYRGT